MLTTSMRLEIEKIEKEIVAELESLKSNDCPDDIFRTFEKSFDKVASEVFKSERRSGNWQAVPIITTPYLGIYGLAKMVRWGEKICKVFLRPEEIKEHVFCPPVLCWALDVDDGRGTLGVKFSNAHGQILSRERYPLTATGILNLCRSPSGVLSHHGIVAAGSSNGAGEVASLWLGGGEPLLGWIDSGSSYSEWGSASCGRYLEL